MAFKKLLPFLALLLFLPLVSHANIAVPWLATSTDAGYIQPNPVNGNNPFLKILSIGTSTFSNGINLVTGCFSVGGVCISSSGGGTPGGLNTQVQYNNNGVFGGVSGATTNGTILSLTNPLLGGATLTTSSVNGVTLTTGGGTTTFLNANGAYSVPTGNTLITAGAGISTTTSTGGAILVSNTGVLSNIAGNGISVSGATGNVTITNTIGYPFPSNATTTLLTLSNGATVGNPFTLSGLGAGELYTNSGGLVGVSGTTTASCSGATACTPFTIFGNTPVTITGTNTTYTAAWPITLTGTVFGFNGLSTTTNLTVGQVPYVTGVNTFGQEATSSILNGTNITVTNGSTAYVLGAQPTISLSGVVAYANGGTGSTTAPEGQLLYGGAASYQSVPTTTVTCTGIITCSAFTTLGASPVTINATGGGSGTVTSISLVGLDGATPITTTGTITAQVSTSTVPTIGGLAYWTGNGTPSTQGTVATTTVSCSGTASCTPFTVLGSSPITISATGGSSFGYPFPNTDTNFGNTANATSSVVGFTAGLLASSTSHFSNADFVTATATQSLAVGTNYQATWASGADLLDWQNIGTANPFTEQRNLSNLTVAANGAESTYSQVVDCSGQDLFNNQNFLDTSIDDYPTAYEGIIANVAAGTCAEIPLVIQERAAGGNINASNQEILMPSGTTAFISAATSSVNQIDRVQIASSTATNVLAVDSTPGTGLLDVGQSTTTVATGLNVKAGVFDVLNNGGFVGIGTQTPSQKLEVDGSVYINAAGTGFGIISRGATSNFGGFQFDTAGSPEWTFGLRNDSTNNYHFFNENLAADAISINQSNNIVTIPDASSTAFSSSYASSTSAFFGTLTLPTLGIPAGAFLAVSPTGQVITTTTPSGTGTNFFTNSGVSTFLSTGTNLGVGTSTPWARLSVNGAPGGAVPVFAVATSTATFSTTTALEVDQNGNVLAARNSSTLLLGLATSSIQSVGGGGPELIGTETVNNNNAIIASHVIGDTQAQWLVQTNGLMGWGPGGTTDQDIEFYRSGVGSLTVQSGTNNSLNAFRVNQFSLGTGVQVFNVDTTDNYVQFNKALVNGASGGATVDIAGNSGVTSLRVQQVTAADPAFAAFVAGDNFLRFSFLANGTMAWSAGATSNDVQFSRTAAGALGIQGLNSTNSATAFNVLQAGGTNVFDVDTLNGTVGIGTTTPSRNLTISSSTAPQIVLTDASATSLPWDFRSINGAFYLSTSSPTTFATSTNALFSIIPSATANATTTFSLTDWVLKQTSQTALLIQDAFGTNDVAVNTASTTGSIFTVAATTSPSIFAPTKLFDVDQYGHLTASSTGPAQPVISSCGTGSPSLGANSNDTTGDITTGTSAATCTLTFARAFSATPEVFITDSNTSAVVDVSARSTTSFTISLASALSAVNVSYFVVIP